MLWVLIWVLLALGACLTLFLLGRRVWRQLTALTRELSTANARLGEISDRLAELDAAVENRTYGEGRFPDGVRSQGPHRRP